VIYAATSYALALLEKLVHANIGKVPKDNLVIDIRIPDGLDIERVTPADVPGWDRPDCLASRAYGDRWHDEGRTVGLLVPSVIAAPEENLVINQDHPEFSRLTHGRPRPVIWDERLFRG